MRILGGHDYYDSALAFGQDRELMFIRQKNNLVDLNIPVVYSIGNSWGEIPGTDMGVNTLSVIFAGKQWTGWRIISNRNSSSRSINIFWDVGQLLDFLGKSSYKIDRHRFFGQLTPLPLKDFLEKTVQQGNNKHLDDMIRYRISIAIYDEGDSRARDEKRKPLWKIDSTGLKEIGFATVLDSYTAFQELSMWVGGVLPRNPHPMVEITDDKIKVAKHGMDKWSFRKHKEDNK